MSPHPDPAKAPSDRAAYPLARLPVLDLDSFARRVAIHPDLLRRFAALGLVPARRDANGGLWFGPEQTAVVARIQRLRAGLSLNYAAIGVILSLLEHIDGLEAAARRRGPHRPEAGRW